MKLLMGGYADKMRCERHRHIERFFGSVLKLIVFPFQQHAPAH